MAASTLPIRQPERRRAVRARRGDPRLRAPVVEVRRRQGAGDPGEVRHVVRPLLPGAQRPDRPSRGARRRPAAGPSAAPARASRQRQRQARRLGFDLWNRCVRQPAPSVPTSAASCLPRGCWSASWRSPSPALGSSRTARKAPTEQRPPAVACPRPTATTTPTAEPDADQASEDETEGGRKRGDVIVEVFNNSGIPGWPAHVRARPSAGWNVVGSDNWYGTIPATTVYYPARLKAAAKILARDLGIQRIMPGRSSRCGSTG